jgi:glycogen debranching enzyme
MRPLTDGRSHLIELRAHPDALMCFRRHSLLITDVHGVIADGAHGYYHDNTRLLSRWRMRIDGEDLMCATASAVDAASMLAYHLAPKFKQQIPDLQPEESGLAVRIARSVDAGMREEITLENYTQQPLNCTLSWDAAADFADIAEAREGKRQQCAGVETRWRDDEATLTFVYQQPRLQRGARLQFEGASFRREDSAVVSDVSLEAGASRRLVITLQPTRDGQPIPAAEDIEPGEVAHTQLETPNATVQAAWDHALGDLAALALGDGAFPAIITPSAGIPTYQALFGRDSITAAFQAAMAEPILMEATLASLAPHIGRRDDPMYDEQPGRIVHQMNPGPLAQLGITPHARYYGDYAAPPAMLILLGQLFAWTADVRILRRYEDTAARIMDWIAGPADADADGFVEYDTRSPKGQKNQGWKDSSMAMVYEDGRGVPNPIATSELQGYVYAGKQQYAIALALGLHRFGDAISLLRQAAHLKRQFNDAFWMPGARFIAMALDGEKRQVRTIASNPGHCLATGIVDAKHAPAVAGRLMAEDMFSGWGVRTLSSRHPSYNPLSYQLGSVWPVENASIAFGFKRYGFDELTNDLARAMFDASALFPHHRLPEVLGGYPRDDEHPHPGVYPRSQSPQAWSASAVSLVIQAMLGLRPFAPLRLLLVDPDLPAWLPDLTLRNLRVGEAAIDIRFHRERDGTTNWRVLKRRGSLRVVRQPPESSVRDGLPQRARDLVGSLLHM